MQWTGSINNQLDEAYQGNDANFKFAVSSSSLIYPNSTLQCFKYFRSTQTCMLITRRRRKENKLEIV